MAKERADVLLQRQEGLSRSKAQGLILTGKVFDGEGRCLKKPGERVADDTEFVVRDGPTYVSRGGEKLAAALAQFDVRVDGVTAIDVGASTGGFTDCLLQHGATRVIAVDVGYGQLAWSLREDERVTALERTNIRHLTPDQLDNQPNFFTIDCSFISLRIVLPPVKALLAPESEGVVLIKPQFEAGKEHVEKGGVVRDKAIRDATVRDVCAFAESAGFTVADTMESPLRGPAGNHEYLTHLRVSR